MAWLKIDQTLRDHHKICDAADDLNVEPSHMAGMMVMLWLWAIDNAPAGSLAGISASSIARGAQYNGDAENFVETLKRRKLLDERPEGLTIHDWDETAGDLINKRRKDAERKAAARAAERSAASSGHPADVRGKSAPRVEKSRVEKSIYTSPKGEEAAATDATPYEQIRLLWNETCASFSKVQGIAGNRKTLTAARWKERPTLEWWRQYFTRIESSDFLKGKNERHWRPTFDWVVNEANMNKIIEGNYDTKGGEDRGTDTAEGAARNYTRGFKD